MHKIMNNLPIEIEKSILSHDKFSELINLQDELNHAFNVRQIFRTETEARVSVLNDLSFPTKASKFWQCIREQTVMLEQLALLSFEFRKNEVSFKRANRDILEKSDALDVEDAVILCDECNFKRKSMLKIAEDRLREIKMWSKLKKEFDDGTFSVDDVNSHQLLSYTKKFALSLANTDKSQYSCSEYQNLVGQFQSSLKRCEETSMIKVLEKELGVDLIKKLTIA